MTKAIKSLKIILIVLLLSASVYAQPTITSFTPTSGPVGTSVTITGTGFNTTPSNNIVYFGATKATVTAATSVQLTVTVPVGATYQPISVLSNGLLAYSKTPFASTYPGWGVVDANAFIPSEGFTAGSTPWSISIGDLDGDGKADLVVANLHSNTVSVFRNISISLGVVSYASKVDYATGTRPYSVSIGELDGDGKPDLAVANDGDNTVSILRNASTGAGVISFTVRQDFGTGTNPHSVSIEDLNGDGKADLAVANYGSNTVSLFRNTSTGPGVVSYAAPVNKATGIYPNSVSIGDLDGDGKVDLAVANNGSNNVSIFRNTSTGAGVISYANKVDRATGQNPNSVSIGDLNGDGKADLAVSNWFSHTISLLRNTRTGTGVISLATKLDYAVGTNPACVSIGDLDGDGKADLAVAKDQSVTGNVSIFRNTSTGAGAISYAARVDYGTGSKNSVSIGDIDGDGKSDLVIAASMVEVILHLKGARQTISFSPIAQRILGDAPVTLNATASSGLPITYNSSNTGVATISGNTATIVGKGVTIITASQSGDSYYGTSSTSQPIAVGPFPSITSFTPAAGSVGTSVTITGNAFNGTAANNIVYFGATKATVTAATTTQLTVTVPIGASYQPISVLANGLIAYSNTPFVTTYTGSGVIDPSTFILKKDFSVYTPKSISIGDFDGDGKPDLAVKCSSNLVSILRSTSSIPGVVSYAPKVDFTVDSGESLSIGDFDGDGKIDIAVASLYNSWVSILRNTSTGVGVISFAAKIDYATGTGRGSYSVSVGDLDADGKVDIAVTNYGGSLGNTISLFRNTSTGAGVISFAAKVDYETASGPRSVSIADFDRDGKADLVVTCVGGNGNTSVLRNTSSGRGIISYAPKVDYPVSGSCVSTGDLDGDGKPDLALVNNTSLSILRNTSTGSGVINFAAQLDFVTGTNPYSVSIGDLDGDGKADIAVANSGGSTVSTFKNTSTGTGVISYAPKVDYTTGNYTEFVSIGDLDGDGKSDLVTSNLYNTVSVNLHKPDQVITFASLPSKTYGDAAFTLNALASSGLALTYTSSNPAVATISGNTATIVGIGSTTITAIQAGNSYFGPTSASQVLAVGPFPTIATFTPASGPIGTSVTINGTGFNGTTANNIVYFGDTRAVVTTATATQLIVTVPVGANYEPISVLVNGLLAYSKSPFNTTYPGWGVIDANTFIPKTDFATSLSPRSVSIGDLDGDGKADLVSANVSSNTISVLRNTSTSAGSVSYAPKVEYTTGKNPYCISIGDLDGDGKADLAVANDNTVSVLLNTSTAAGEIGYAPAVDYETDIVPFFVSIGDLDGDGKADLAVANLVSNTVSLLRNTSTGPGVASYAQKVNYTTGSNPYSVSIGDLDGDGKADLAVANYASNTISLFRNTSTGYGVISYAPKVDYATGTNPHFVSIGDLDGDGNADIVVANRASNTVSIMRNTSNSVGVISFAGKMDYATGADPRSVSIGDLDGDGKPDLAVANLGSNKVSVFRNTSTEAGVISYAPNVDYATGSSPISVSIGDLDGDGKSDLAVTNYTSNTISVILHKAKADQLITFNSLSSKTLGDEPFSLTATASSGLPITYSSSNTAVATISGNIVTLVGLGSTIITASQPGNTIYSPATSVSQTLTVIELGVVPDALEFAALKDLYIATAGASWTNKTNWPTTWPASASSAQFGTWFGVTVQNGDITSLYFEGNNLSGALRVTLGSLINLQTLGLSGNQITGLPLEIGNLTNLIFLNVSANQITSIPSTLGNLSNLRFLQMDNNPINSSIPSAISNLTNLQQLNMYGCGLTGTIPASLSNLHALEQLTLNNNQLSGILPQEFGTMTSLRSLEVSDNLLSGQFPVQLTNLGYLTYLNLSNNQLSGALPPAMGNMQGLGNMDISGNQFSGPLPDAISSMIYLNRFNVARNQFSGPIPMSIGGMQNLRVLNFSQNQFLGPIPPTLANLRNLTDLDLSGNQFTGAIPLSLADFPNLYSLIINSNQFTGNIPEQLGNLPSLYVLDLSNNKLTGAVPASLISLPLLLELNLANNNLTSFPNFTTSPRASGLNIDIRNNYLSYESIEPNLNAIGGHDFNFFYFTPQKNINDNPNLAVTEGSRLEIPARPLTANTIIIWEKNISGTWTTVSASNQNPSGSSFVINSATPADAGSYRYRMTNAFVSAVSPLTITSDPIVVTITDPVNNPATYRAKALYNGNITAASWRTDPAYATNNTDLKGLYLYTYDDKYQFKEAQFADPNFTLNTYALSGNKFREFGYTYDANGNILSLKRYDNNGSRIHNLAYSYQANKNKLSTVTNATAAFRSYTYNGLGQMESEMAADEENKYVIYDVTGKVVRVYGAGPGPGGGGPPGPPNPDSGPVPPPLGAPNSYGDVVPTGYTLRTDFSYDDRGFRLAKKTFDATGTLVFTTWYVRDASGNVLSIYEEKATAPAQLTRTETPVYGSGKLGLYRQKLDGGYEYVYELTDHLGNVRATLKQDETVYLATLEDTGSPDWSNPRLREMQYFKNLFETEKRDSRMNKTAPSAEVPSPAYTAYLNWIDDGNATTREDIIGPAIALKVEAGDQISLETWAKFERKVSYSRNTTTGMMASLLASSFVNPGFGIETLAQATQDFTNGLPGALANTGADPPTQPYAYLNYLVFDRNYLTLDGGAVRVPETAGFDPGLEIAVQPQQLAFSSPINVTQSGYIYVWVSNESQATKVWFDDLKVTHRGSRVTQATDYYAFGSVMREQKTEEDARYRYGYQGQFAEKDEETGWSHFELREYDAVIGRWTKIDPFRINWSPYVGMNNNAINLVDKRGGCPTGDCPGYVEGESNSNVMLAEVTVTAPRYFGGGIFDRVTASWERQGLNYSTFGRINFGVYDTPSFDFTLFQGSGASINLVAIVGINLSLDRVKTIDKGVKNNDLYFTFGPSLGLDVSADVHGTHFSNFDNLPVTSGDVAGPQYNWGSGNGPFGYQRSGSITFPKGSYFPAFGNTISHQGAIGIGPSSLSPWSGTVGVSYTLNLSNVARRLNTVFK